MRRRLTAYTALPDQSYDPRVTDLSAPLVPKQSDTPTALDAFRNRNTRSTYPVQLTGGQALRVLPANLRRTGLIIQNRDTANPLFVGWGNSADANSFSIAAGGSILEDFTCPNTEVYLFATTNLLAVVIETTRSF